MPLTILLNRDLFRTLFLCLLLSVPLTNIPLQSQGPRYSILTSDTTDSLTSPSVSKIDCIATIPSESIQEADTIALVVESSISADVSDAVNQYRKDLSDTGYRTILYTNAIATAEDLKDLLSDWFESDNLVGAVLIGRLPYALYHHEASESFSAETFICDLYLMDLDGQWSDINPVDGIYDTHSSSPVTDIYPEIFVGRIDPQCLTWGSGVADHITNYLSRVHNYRIGGVQRNHRALAYIDDDWSKSWGARWCADLALAYDTSTNIRLPTTYTNASDWLTNRLTQDYQWGHLCAHSSSTMHYFGPGGSGEGTASSAQVRAAPPSFNFYNLFCCSGAKWTANDNLAVTYTFSGDFSLATIGSSKTGSMMDCDAFYEPLSQNTTLGTSLIYWFSQSLTSASSASSEYLEWYYGMNIVGDPLLSINYDCTVLAPYVVSQTHPGQDQWYRNCKPQFNWTIPPDVNGIEGYYYIIDQNPSTIPTSLTGTYATINGTCFEHLDNGTWYFHIVARDSVGNVGASAAHYQIHIDTTPPEAVITNPAQFCNHSSSSLGVTWSYQDDFSGYSHAEITIDGDTQSNTTALNYLLKNLSEGTHNLNLTVFDQAGNSVSEFLHFRIDLTNPEITSLTINENQSIWPDLNVVWSVQNISDYRYAEIFLDSELMALVYVPECSCLIVNSEYGSHVVNVTVYDWANRTASYVMEVMIPNLLVNYVLLASGGVFVIILFLLGWKRKEH